MDERKSLKIHEFHFKFHTEVYKQFTVSDFPTGWEKFVLIPLKHSEFYAWRAAEKGTTKLYRNFYIFVDLGLSIPFNYLNICKCYTERKVFWNEEKVSSVCSPRENIATIRCATQVLLVVLQVGWFWWKVLDCSKCCAIYPLPLDSTLQ